MMTAVAISSYIFLLFSKVSFDIEPDGLDQNKTRAANVTLIEG